MRTRRTIRALLAASLAVALGGCERPPVDVEQLNFRGLGTEQVRNPRAFDRALAANQAPEPLPPAQPGGPPASTVFQNLRVLGHLSSYEMTRVMGAITTWVAPQQGCTYCHAGGNFASEDAPYTKAVSRRMLQMTMRINSAWKAHVGDTGVTCYTCHRGQVVPANVWSADPGPRSAKGRLGYRAAQNTPALGVGLTSLPYDPFSAFLKQKESEEIRVQSASALPRGSTRTIKDTEWTYGFMIHISESLGVNCTYCHNSRAFSPWEASTPARAQAWHGIRMVREINEEYISSLAHVFPDNRKGPMGDVLKVNCATCHNGLPKPLMGVSMLADYPELAAPGPVSANGGSPAPEGVLEAASPAATTQGGAAPESPAAPETPATASP
ncbi:MAG: photosynthetic reaction center cytochrome PufC [Myxococcota bacterium]|nr:photosynthetic reaction center cytochrome PufC [Myxococcota bacterium]